MLNLDLPKETVELLKNPYYIAEISCNHMGDFDVLKDSINAAFEVNASAVKLQSSTPDCLTRNFDSSEFIVSQENSPWHGKHLYKLYQETCTPLDWPLEFIKRYKKMGKTIFSTPFSPEMVNMLESNVSPELYKVSSIDWNYLDLIKRCVETGKPVLISLVNPSEQWPILMKYGFKNLIPMYCISQYPSLPQHMNYDELLYISKSEIFGFSDHSLNSSLASLAVSLGATIIEKHFMLNNQIDSADSHFSSTPEEFKLQITQWDEISKARKSKSSLTTIPIGRSVYLDVDVRFGEILESHMVCFIRPGGQGISPLELSKYLGKPFALDCKKGQPLKASHFIRDTK